MVLSRWVGSVEDNLCFRRALYQWEVEDLRRLYEMLSNAPALVEGTPDSLSWAADSSGLFSVASAYKGCELSLATNSKIADLIWKNVSPPRVQFFGWLAWKGRIKTSYYLQRIGVLSDGFDPRCIFCKGEVENINHVLLFCPFTWRIWSRILQWWGIQWVLPGSISCLFNWCIGIKLQKQEQMIWRAIPLAVLWSVWNRRNECIFGNAQVDIDDLCESIKVRIALWVKSSCPSINYSVFDLVHHLQQVRICIRRGF
ncbi:unnamed protein product [Camellia sinensis]